MSNQSIVATALVAVAVLSACTDPEEFASFRAQSTNDLPECFARQFPFEPTFHAVRDDDGRISLFLQTPPDVQPDYNAVYFELAESAVVEDGEPVELNLDGSPEASARGRITFFASCPDQRESLVIRGGVRFDSFGTDEGDVVAGELVDASATSGRTGEVLIDELTGQWRFVVRLGPPHETFYAVPQGQ